MIRLTPPTNRKHVLSGWGASRAYRGGWHAGLDFPDATGKPMLAAAPGVVSYVKNKSTSFAGKYTVIDHGDGILTRYLHANANYKKIGDRVRRGEQIGEVGKTGTKRSGAHVHFDVRLKPDALKKFVARYGKPTTGFTGKLHGAHAVPAETFMDDVTYKEGVLEKSIKKGVKPYVPGSMGDKSAFLLKAGLAVVAGLVIARYIR
jgi:murein DD-endopeptidase MepM/ murein hydrolase activator NlpD